MLDALQFSDETRNIDRRMSATRRLRRDGGSAHTQLHRSMPSLLIDFLRTDDVVAGAAEKLHVHQRFALPCERAFGLPSFKRAHDPTLPKLPKRNPHIKDAYCTSHERVTICLTAGKPKTRNFASKISGQLRFQQHFQCKILWMSLQEP